MNMYSHLFVPFAIMRLGHLNIYEEWRLSRNLTKHRPKGRHAFSYISTYKRWIIYI